MATKNIAIREEVYNKLRSAKGEDKSFSETIERLLQKRTSLLSFSGVFKDDDPDLKLIEKEVKSLRKGVSRADRLRAQR